ncbi:gamma-glutamyltranspeptidase/glutathione hydrolase [Kaistia dalseonensis]|uniref:Gamma-glutamyltranspeptidase/glutathione hydrolase n=1 Tax=Kaistia dalseonensis TaxID=410840 RepID=A0ABU0H8T7_9HYPH|nr:gamma-glutamyltranspeptidase/glutathione hydrolase [Kaistia dalseonensis]
MDFSQPYAAARSPVLGENVVATSQPLAAQAGLRMLLAGGNAVDAAIAAAMTLTVVEPTGCGIGSDGFAILWDGKELHGLNASGRSPAGWTPERFAGLTKMPERGWDAVTVPGAVSAWIALWRRFGSLPLATIAAPAIHYAREGFPVSPIIARLWAQGGALLGDQPGFAEAFLPGGRAPKAGERIRLLDHATTLERIVETEGEAFYRGDLAARMAAHARAHSAIPEATMTEDDLAAHQADWVGTLSTPFAGGSVHEIPPNGQGIATLIALGLLEAAGIGDRPVDDVETVHLAIEATKLALADTARYIADRDAMAIDPSALLDPAYAAERARLIDRARARDPRHGAPKPGGTVYLTAADASGMMVSFIQSNYMGFGSGIVVPGTGISLQNRGTGFTLERGHANEVGPRKRPFHTIIPGFALDGTGQPLLSFGVMGGPMQAQGHLQMALRIMRYGQNPQAAADAPRWRVGAGREVAVEASMDPALVEGLRARGHSITVEAPDAFFAFGGAQIIAKTADGYVAGSDPRKDGHAAAF